MQTKTNESDEGMRKSIDLRKIDNLFHEFIKTKNKKESFSEFIEKTNDNGKPAWDLVDSIGIVSPEEFKDQFEEKFIKEYFCDLAADWFKGIYSQIDLGIVLNRISEKWTDRYQKWHQKHG